MRRFLIKNTVVYYGLVTQLLHWLMFVLMVSMITLGFIMEDQPSSLLKFQLYGVHKSLGFTVLVLALLRLIWRLSNPVPALPPTTKPFEALAAHGVHWLLYGIMVLIPLTGWLMSSAAGFPVSVFGWFVLPDFVTPSKDLMVFYRQVHEWSVYAFIAIGSMHALAGLMHHFFYKDTILVRMLIPVKVEK